MPVSCLKDSKIDFRQLVDSHINPMGEIGREDIKKIIPYGDDFLFLDFVDSITSNSIRGFFEVSAMQPYVKSHFVHNPIMPGCLVAESFAQAGTILIRHQLGLSAQVDIYVGKIETARFTAVVKPGQMLRHEVTLKNLNVNLGIARLQGESYIGENSIAVFSLILAVVESDVNN